IVYDGLAHDASGAVSGVGGENLGTPAFSYTDASNTADRKRVEEGNYTDTAALAGNTDYNSASNTTSVVIDKASATVQVTGAHVVYDGLAHDATGAVTGVGGENLGSPGFSYTDASNTAVDHPMHAGSYTVTAVFA